MATSNQAIVTPEVLKWARELDSVDVEMVVHSLNVKSERIYEWENDSKYSTMNQAKNWQNCIEFPSHIFFYQIFRGRREPKKLIIVHLEIMERDYRCLVSCIGYSEILRNAVMYYFKCIKRKTGYHVSFLSISKNLLIKCKSHNHYIQLRIREILAEHRELVESGKRMNSADPFVIALAQVMGCTVVIDESMLMKCTKWFSIHRCHSFAVPYHKPH